jgi:hypothetical protein
MTDIRKMVYEVDDGGRGSLKLEYRGLPVTISPEHMGMIDEDVVVLLGDKQLTKLLPPTTFSFMVDGTMRSFTWDSTVKDKAIANMTREYLFISRKFPKILSSNIIAISVKGSARQIANAGTFLSEVAGLDTFEGSIEEYLLTGVGGWKKYPSLLSLNFTDGKKVLEEVAEVRDKLTLFESIMALLDIEHAIKIQESR